MTAGQTSLTMRSTQKFGTFHARCGKDVQGRSRRGTGHEFGARPALVGAVSAEFENAAFPDSMDLRIWRSFFDSAPASLVACEVVQRELDSDGPPSPRHTSCATAGSSALCGAFVMHQLVSRTYSLGAVSRHEEASFGVTVLRRIPRSTDLCAIHPTQNMHTGLCTLSLPICYVNWFRYAKYEPSSLL